MGESGEGRAVIGRRAAGAPPVRPGDDSDDGGGLDTTLIWWTENSLPEVVYPWSCGEKIKGKS